MYVGLFICLLAAWQEVAQKLGDRGDGESTDRQGPIQYTEKTPSAAMKSKYLRTICIRSPAKIPSENTTK